MDNISKVYLFEKASIPEAAVKLAIPTIVSSLVTIIYNLADTYFVGQINDPIQNAAMALVSTMLIAQMMVTNMFGVGGSSLMSRMLGSKEYEKVRNTSVFAIYGSILFGLLISFIFAVFRFPIIRLLGGSAENMEATWQYMKWIMCWGSVPAILNTVLANLIRAEGSALQASIGTMSGCVLNVILDPFFILPLGFNMGAEGAGLATMLSNCAACLYFLAFLIRKKNDTYVSFHPKHFSLEKEIWFGVLAVGFPVGIKMFFTMTAMGIRSRTIAKYGSVAIAALGIATRITNVPMQATLGLTNGLIPLIGYNYAAKNQTRVKGAIQFVLKMATGILVGTAVLCIVFAGKLVGIFIKDPETIRIGSILMIGFALAQPVHGIDALGDSTAQATGKGLLSFGFGFVRMFICEIGFTVLLDRLFPMYGVGYAQFATESVMAAVALLFLFFMIRNLGKEGEK